MSDGDETPETAHIPAAAEAPQYPRPPEEGRPADAAAPPGGAGADTAVPPGQANTAVGTEQADAPGAADPVAQAVAGVPGPRLVRRVVCGYRLGWLGGDWLRTWRRLDQVLAEAGLNVTATLAPLENLPRDTDILVVPPTLREAARAAALPNTPILVTPASAAAGAFADLVSRLEAGTELAAERVKQHA